MHRIILNVRSEGGSQGLNVGVPAGSMDKLGGVRGLLQGLENGNICLGGREALNIALIDDEVVKDGNTGVTVKVGKAHFSWWKI